MAALSEKTIKIIGQIKTVFPQETFGNFTKQVLWVEETDVQYPDTFEITFTGNRMEDLKGIKAGLFVEIQAFAKGRYSSKNGKEYVFNSLNALAITKI